MRGAKKGGSEVLEEGEKRVRQDIPMASADLF